MTGHGGDEIEAYAARPLDESPRGGVVVIHHMPGYDAGTKEITRNFAFHGYNAVMPNLYWREAPGASPDDAAAESRARGGVPDDRFVGDAEGAMNYLKNLSNSNGKVAIIGYCSGGRHAWLANGNLPFDGAIVCYGAFINGETPEGFPPREDLRHLASTMHGPILGLFGNDDVYPTPEQVDALEAVLGDAGKPYEFHRYDGAGHAFFCVERTAYRPEAAVDGWAKIWAFLDTTIGG
ncbi:MAG: dienelactone hydrolase family protein [Frankiaceae bacterium]|nr:dienelactone hydrolase family protein [Frankiaceae bacterium]MBV9871656.1 dienelactone hydrolase family protein [Frankiaceae bacterium]